jgi:hypothetical protein
MFSVPRQSQAFIDTPNCVLKDRVQYSTVHIPNVFCDGRGDVSSTRDLGPTLIARGQSIGISIGMLPQTLIMSRLDQLSRLGARI